MYGNVSPRRFTPRLPPIEDPGKIQYLEERLKKQEETTQALLGKVNLCLTYLHDSSCNTNVIL